MIVSTFIHFAFKQSLMCDDSWENHAMMRSCNCKQIWGMLISVILMVFKILVKKLQFEDTCTEAFQEKMRLNHETFCKIFTTTFVILAFAI